MGCAGSDWSYFRSRAWTGNMSELEGNWELGPYPADTSADVADEQACLDFITCINVYTNSDSVSVLKGGGISRLLPFVNSLQILDNSNTFSL